MTENKRYFKQEWEEEYYIFDSQTISEKEFDEKVEYEDYQAFADSMQGDEVVNRLNGLDGTIKDLSDDYEQLLKENKELRIQYNHIREQSNEFHRIARENANRVGKLEKENEQLKQQLNDNEVEWLRNNTVWEQMPSSKRTFTKTSKR